ncbi:MAG: nucleoside recognition domain-containing protein [Rivularia sp. (in: cyanobacteria)]
MFSNTRSLPTQSSIVVIGKENTGKSQLIASLTGRNAYSSNFRGSTVICDTYKYDKYSFVDTPGIFYRSDSATTRMAIEQLQTHDTVLLVVKATHLDEDLGELLPLLANKRGIVVITFWDKVLETDLSREVVRRWSQTSGLTFIAVNARKLTQGDRTEILNCFEQPTSFPVNWQIMPMSWQIQPKATLLEHPRIGWLLAIILLLLPAIMAVWFANGFAGVVEPAVKILLNPLIQALQQLPSPLPNILVGNYGLVTMGPLLFVWAVPTVILYALFLGGYKASGLVERITVAIHPLLRPFGLSGRDLVRVIMGFGCNVPAVISTRSCSSCSRKTCISAIAFGSACSYQFGATLGVFSAANQPMLVIPYLLYLAFTTLIYTRIVSSPVARSRNNPLVIEKRTFLEFPRLKDIIREASGTVNQFLTQAIPIFLLITIIASMLDWLGIISALSSFIHPLMGIFNLPKEAALPVILASIRKDGLLLFAEAKTISLLTPGQILTGVYLGGVLLPCLVTGLTISREQSPRFALMLVARQMLAAVSFSLILGWASRLLA